MLELVYTSAPRLLEAGKTGFGTLICTKGMPQPLISFLERISAFDRGAGVDASECYTVYKMGSAVFHVFSRIGDCGADYTGRTNHVAHHFVVEEGTPEARELTEFHTPASVLLGLKSMWETACPSAPGRIDERAVHIPTVNDSPSAWAELTGSPGKARWMATPPYDSACCLVFSSVARIPLCLRLLHEGYLYKPRKGWGCGFSTALVGTISANLISVTCLDARQHVAGVKPGKSTPVLELSSSLAMPPERPQSQPATSPTSTSSPPPIPFSLHPSFQPTPGIQPTTPPFPTALSPTPTPQALPPTARQSDPLPPSRQKRDRRRGRKKSVPVVMIAVCCILALLLVFLPSKSGEDTQLPGRPKPPDGAAPPGGVTPQDGTAPLDGITPQDGAAPLDGMTPQDGTAPPNGVAPQDGTAPPNGVTPQDGTAPPDGVTPQDGTAPPNGVTPQDGTAPPNGVTPQDGTAPPDGATPQDGTAPPNGVTPQDGTAPQDGATPQDGTAPPDGATKRIKDVKIEVGEVDLIRNEREKVVKFKFNVTGRLPGTKAACELGYDPDRGWKLYVGEQRWDDDTPLALDKSQEIKVEELNGIDTEDPDEKLKDARKELPDAVKSLKGLVRSLEKAKGDDNEANPHTNKQREEGDAEEESAFSDDKDEYPEDTDAEDFRVAKQELQETVERLKDTAEKLEESVKSFGEAKRGAKKKVREARRKDVLSEVTKVKDEIEEVERRGKELSSALGKKYQPDKVLKRLRGAVEKCEKGLEDKKKWEDNLVKIVRKHLQERYEQRAAIILTVSEVNTDAARTVTFEGELDLGDKKSHE